MRANEQLASDFNLLLNNFRGCLETTQNSFLTTKQFQMKNFQSTVYCQYLIVGIDKETMASNETENCFEYNLAITFPLNTSRKSISTEILAP